jgi:transcriptional regulator with XRE-family HTH domain
METFDIGSKIKALMALKKISVSDIASKMKISTQAVYDIIRKREINTLTLRKLSIALDVPIEYWFKEKEKTYSDVVQPLNKIEEPTVKLKQNFADYGKTECPNCNHLLKQIDLQQEIIDCLKRELGYKKERKCS